jgi:hypothetical protein
MKKNGTLFSKSGKSGVKNQELLTVAVIVLSVAVVVLSCVVAVLLAQVDGHRKSIEGLYSITTGMPTSE